MKKAAFTLIELIISISIIALIVGVFVSNYYGSEPQSQLVNATSALMSDLRSAQTRGASGINYGSDVVSGWGVNLAASSSKYIIFADTNNNRVYDGAFESVASKGGREVTLPAGITISNINLDTPINVTYYNDLGTLRSTIIKGNHSYVLLLEITLREEETGATKHVYVNPAGLIYSDL